MLEHSENFHYESLLTFLGAQGGGVGGRVKCKVCNTGRREIGLRRGEVIRDVATERPLIE